MTDRGVALTVAGSDSGRGAGIQADLKTMEALGVFGTSTVTSVTDLLQRLDELWNTVEHPEHGTWARCLDLARRMHDLGTRSFRP